MEEKGEIRMLKRKSIYLVVVFITIGLLLNDHFSEKIEAQETTPANSDVTEKGVASEQSVLSVLWSQQSAERKALYYQGFNIGKLKVVEALKKEGAEKKKAIVLDIDETILDNSPYFAYLVKKGKTFPYQWNEWVQSASAKPLPGALEFLNEMK